MCAVRKSSLQIASYAVSSMHKVGETVGDAEGASEGEVEGAAVGLKLGPVVGEPVGPEVGDALGGSVLQMPQATGHSVLKTGNSSQSCSVMDSHEMISPLTSLSIFSLVQRGSFVGA
jgi:phage tail tape-measure protein